MVNVELRRADLVNTEAFGMIWEYKSTRNLDGNSRLIFLMELGIRYFDGSDDMR
jgi:hypothetical protein